jgi:hypothetical protein
MPDLVVTVRDRWLTIDGPLPDGYRLIVHNHTYNSDYYPYMEEIVNCRYTSPAEESEIGPEDEGYSCYLYVEDSSGSS